MRVQSKYKWVIPSDINNICTTIKQIICIVTKSFGILDECNLFELKVILNELLLNAIKHGNKENPDKSVRIFIKIISDDYIFLLIEDEGDGCNYKDVISNACCRRCNAENIADVKETGRGILIVKSLSDKLISNKKGNRIIVYKKLIHCQ